jgi:hypothetical protein
VTRSAAQIIGHVIAIDVMQTLLSNVHVTSNNGMMRYAKSAGNTIAIVLILGVQTSIDIIFSEQLNEPQPTSARAVKIATKEVAYKWH